MLVRDEESSGRTGLRCRYRKSEGQDGVLPRLLEQKLLCKVPERLYCFGQVMLGASRKRQCCLWRMAYVAGRTILLMSAYLFLYLQC